VDRLITKESFADELVAAIPEFRPQLEDHQAAFGEVMDHLLLADLVRMIEEAEARGDWLLIDRCLAFLEQAVATTDLYLLDLVAASFIENLEPWSDKHVRIFDRFPPRLAAQLQRQRGETRDGASDMDGLA
jgi:hypothetical protein